MTMGCREYTDPRPRAAVSCMECPRTAEDVDVAMGEDIGAKWRSHAWYRVERRGMICNSCWDGVPDAA